MKKNIIVIVLALIFTSVAYGFTVEKTIQNLVWYVQKMVFTDNGLKSWNAKIVIDGNNGSVTMSGALNIQEWALKDNTVLSEDIKDWTIKREDLDFDIGIWLFKKIWTSAVYTGWNVWVWTVDKNKLKEVRKLQVIQDDNNSWWVWYFENKWKWRWKRNSWIYVRAWDKKTNKWYIIMWANNEWEQKFSVMPNGNVWVWTVRPHAQLELKWDARIRLNWWDNNNYWDINAYDNWTHLLLTRNWTTNVKFYDNWNVKVRWKVYSNNKELATKEYVNSKTSWGIDYNDCKNISFWWESPTQFKTCSRWYVMIWIKEKWLTTGSKRWYWEIRCCRLK